MFSFFKMPSESATLQAKAAQDQTMHSLVFTPANDDTTEAKYQHNYYGREDGEETAG